MNIKVDVDSVDDDGNICYSPNVFGCRCIFPGAPYAEYLEETATLLYSKILELRGLSDHSWDLQNPTPETFRV